MTDCDHCGENHDLTLVLEDVRMRGGLVSSIKPKYVVCAGCKGDLEENEDISW